MGSWHHPGVVCPFPSTRRLAWRPRLVHLPAGLAGASGSAAFKAGLSCAFLAAFEGCGPVGGSDVSVSAREKKPWAGECWVLTRERAEQRGRDTPADVPNRHLGRVADNAARPATLQLPARSALARRSQGGPACTAPAGLTAGRSARPAQ